MLADSTGYKRELLADINAVDYEGRVSTLIDRLNLFSRSLPRMFAAINHVPTWEFTVTDVNERTSLSKSTVRRYLRLIEDAGFLRVDRSNKTFVYTKCTVFDLPDGYVRE